MSDIQHIRLVLTGAKTLAAIKRVHDLAGALLKEAAAANDFALLDECTAVRLACTRNGGALLLAGAERVAGVDAELWCKRAKMDETGFASIVRRAKTMQRRRAGEPPKAARCSGDETFPQAKTLLSSWQLEGGYPTRYVVGVDMKRYRTMTGGGGDVEKIEAKLIAEVLERAV